MESAQITAPNKALITTASVPQIGPDDVLIKVQAAGICGTDLHIFKGEYEAIYPLIPGHEFSGEIIAVGDNVVRHKIGDRVTADPNIPCNRCVYCQRNEPNQCEHLAAVGVTRDGGFADFVGVPESNVFNISTMSYSSAALIEPLACVVWGLKRVQIQSGDRVLIFGAGPMGVLLMQAVNHAGATETVIADLSEYRLAMAESLGATRAVHANDLKPDLYDVVVDATGIPSVIEKLFDYAKPRGKIWIFGVVPNGTQIPFPAYDVFRKDLSIFGSFAVNRTFPQAIALIQSGVVQVESLISHQLPLSDFVQGLDIAQHDPSRMKVQFTW